MTRLARHLTTTALALCAAGAAIALAVDAPPDAATAATAPAATTAPATTAHAAPPTASTLPATTTASASDAPTTVASPATTTASVPASTTAPATTTASGAAGSTAGPTTTSSNPTFTGRPGSRDGYRDRYAVLADRNIFVKERWRITPSSRNGGNDGGRNSRNDTPRETRQPPAESAYILTGIVLEEGQVHAFVEDVKAGKVLRLSRGDAVARGQIVDISIDAVQYLAAGQQVWVELGRDFTGAIPSLGGSTTVAAASGGTTSTTGPTSAPSGAPSAGALPIDPNNPALTLEERMKLRRQQQLNK